jgi:uncharacterized protein DUF732
MKRLLMLTSVAAVIGMAAPAYADPPTGPDADFINQLTAAGLSEDDPAKAVAAAKDMCSLEENGTPDPVIQSNLVSRNPGLTVKEASDFMRIARAQYCPAHMSGPGQSPKPTGTQEPKPSS